MSNSNRRRRRGPRPQGAPEPRDYQAPKSAAQREGEGVKTVTIEWHGVKLDVPADPQQWNPYTVILPLTSNNTLGALPALLGPVQLAKMQVEYPNATLPELYELFELIAKATGFGRWGNS